MSSTSNAPHRRQISPVLTYSLGRLALFAVVAGGLYLIGFRSWFLILIALLLSMPLSYFLLRRPRMAFARRIEERGEQRRELRAKLRGDAPPEQPPDR
jgi:hypothetical protein